MTEQFSRRDFLSASSRAGLAVAMAGVAPTVLVGQGIAPDSKPAVLGGTPVSSASLGTRWPVLQGEEETAVDAGRIVSILPTVSVGLSITA